MTTTEPNAKAARLCFRPEQIIVRRDSVERWDDSVRHHVDFSPCTSPADCAVVIDKMREKGWELRLAAPVTGNCGASYGGPADKEPRGWFTAHATTWTHAITAAAVAAWEGAI